MTRPRWPDEKLDELRVLVADPAKYSAAQIADLLHVKRNAVIGACFRNGIKLQRKPCSAGPDKRAQRVRREGQFPKAPKWVLKPTPHKPSLADVVSLNLPLDDLANSQCRFPYGDGPFFFCGNPQQAESSYCPGHHRLCHQKPQEYSDAERERRHRQGLSNVRKGFWRDGHPRKRTAA